MRFPSAMISELPISSILPELRSTLSKKNAVILSAPTGSGKTTCVPLALLNEDWLAGRRVLILEPRRLAARMACRRMAVMLNEPVGRTVGYRVRFDNKVSSSTRIEVLTEGILTRRLQSDPALEDVGLVIFDEFHERSIHADLALALCLDVVNSLREDLKIMIMSATLDIQALAGVLHDPAIIIGEGQAFPVAVRYMEQTGNVRPSLNVWENAYSFHRLIEEMAGAIRQAVDEEEGDVLAFLPGAGEIRQVGSRLADRAARESIALLPLYGNLSREQQDRAIMPDPSGRRRIVLTTSIAETSLTIEGVRIVVDSGWSRVLRFDPNSGLSRLITVRESRSSADQRTGRAGRLEQGICYRLWNKVNEQYLPSYNRPEILDADLAPLALDLAFWGVSGPGDLPWLDLPPAGHYAQAVDLLTLLGALDRHGRITQLGKRMAVLPVHPRLARMLAEAEKTGGLGLACDLAALLSERDIIGNSGGVSRPVAIEVRLQALDAFRKGDRNMLRSLDAEDFACAGVDRAVSRWRRLFHCKEKNKGRNTVGGLLVLAYPDRIAQLRPAAHERYKIANGRGAFLPEIDQLAGSPYLVAAHVDAGRVEGRIYLASAITAEELYERLAGLITITENIAWDNKIGSVTSNHEYRLLQLVLDTRPISDVDPELVKDAMLAGIRQVGLMVLPWNKEARMFQARISSLRSWQPDGSWPDVSDAALERELDSWLGPYLYGITRRRQLSRLDLELILRNLLDRDMHLRLEQEAPTHIRAPSGSRLRLEYEEGKPPVLAVRLQEMFGLADTPCVCRGRVQVLLHLLSPARRPIQITQDLRAFWNGAYREVKKELKGRYPKHHWPDDPWSAMPTARVKPRRKK